MSQFYTSSQAATQGVDEDDFSEEEEIPEGTWGRLTIEADNINESFYLCSDEPWSIGRGSKTTVSFPLAFMSLVQFKVYQLKNEIYFEDTSTNGTHVFDPTTGKSSKITKRAIIANSGMKFTIASPKRENDVVCHFIRIYNRPMVKNYILSETLGTGAFATVFLGVEKNTHERVAIKSILKKKLSRDNIGVMDEIDVLRTMDHPGIVKLIDTHEDDDYLYMILELVTGGDLADVIMERGMLTENEVRPLFIQLLRVLRYLHDRDIVHRDLKPENILIEGTHTIKVSDFGLARVIKESAFSHTMCGTPEYLAPEVFVKDKNSQGYNKAVDMWAAGVLLYILVIGYHPFNADENSTMSLFELAQRAELTFPRDVALSNEAKDLISRLLKPNPAVRLTAKQSLVHPWVKMASKRTRPVINTTATPKKQKC